MSAVLDTPVLTPTKTLLGTDEQSRKIYKLIDYDARTGACVTTYAIELKSGAALLVGKAPRIVTRPFITSDTARRRAM